MCVPCAHSACAMCVQRFYNVRAIFVQFLCNLNKEFSVPGRLKLRSQLALFAEMLREKIVEKIDKEVEFFSDEPVPLNL